MATGFANSFTSGEISGDAWDRTDIQPISKGCEEALNLVVKIAGPLAKRRGFWRLGDAFNSAIRSNLVPFRRSIDDALMLEFADLTVRVWNNNGSLLLDGGGNPVVFGSPYAAADLDKLRWKQVNDVIYFRTSDGKPPYSLQRNSNTSWSFFAEAFPNGPWRPENVDATSTITVIGANELDVNPDTQAGTILVGTVVNLASSKALFDPSHVGAMFRLRQTDGAPGAKSWSVGFRPPLGSYCVSNGRVYKSIHVGADDKTVTNPPANQTGSQSDGGNTWLYRHDGAGVVQITGVTDATHAMATVIAAVPFRSGVATPYWAEGAYSNFRGWPRMWPSMREERLVDGATASNLDFIDLTETAGFSPTTQSFKPGLGSGVVLATDAVRRRVGSDSSELIWASEATYLLIGTGSGEYLVAGSVLDEPITPSTVVVKGLSEFGSADAHPVKAHKSLIHITRGGRTLREISVDTSQVASGDDLTVLAQDITARDMVELAWVPQPDESLWMRLADGGLATMVYHKEQAVRGFSRLVLPGGFVCERMAVLPGPGRLETLWGIFSRTKNGVHQQMLWMQSQPSDQLFMDCAEFYSGAAVTVVGGLAHLEGETVRVLADGAQIDGLVVTLGKITLPQPAGTVLTGLGYKARFKSLKLDKSLGGTLNERQRVTGCTVSLKTAQAYVGLDGAQLERVNPRGPANVPATSAQRMIKPTNFAGDTDRDPRIVVEDDTAYDCVIYSLKPTVTGGG